MTIVVHMFIDVGVGRKERDTEGYHRFYRVHIDSSSSSLSCSKSVSSTSQ